MKFHVLTLFPEMIEHAVKFGVVAQACKKGLISIATLNPRQFTTDVHQTVDDRPFGGGDGMIMLAEPLSLALNHLQAPEAHVVHLSPRGRPLHDNMARRLAETPDLVLISSRYGGVDQRFINQHVDEEISIGDYVLSGGELAALVLIDSVARHVPGVLGNRVSSSDESFAMAGGWLEHPQFTRPRNWEGVDVPQRLTSGDHAKVESWKRALSLLVTLELRPDLVKDIARIDSNAAAEVLDSLSDADFLACGLRDRQALRRALERIK